MPGFFGSLKDRVGAGGIGGAFRAFRRGGDGDQDGQDGQEVDLKWQAKPYEPNDLVSKHDEQCQEKPAGEPGLDDDGECAIEPIRREVATPSIARRVQRPEFATAPSSKAAQGPSRSEEFGKASCKIEDDETERFR